MKILKEENTSYNSIIAPGKRLSGDGYDFIIDHVDYCGGIFSYKGSAGNYIIGKTYTTNSGNEKCTLTATAIHVYPNGNAELNFNGIDNYGIHFNDTYKFKVNLNTH